MDNFLDQFIMSPLIIASMGRFPQLGKLHFPVDRSHLILRAIVTYSNMNISEFN